MVHSPIENKILSIGTNISFLPSRVIMRKLGHYNSLTHRHICCSYALPCSRIILI